VHGDLGQGAREQALRAFRNGKVDVLVATDVAARGIDVEGITHVVNYQCPEDEKTYLHRTGRTGRAGRTGVAVTLVDWDDLPRWGLINKALDLGIPEPEETYSSSDHLYSDLDIPTGVTGTLPRAARTRAGLAAEEVEDLGETGKHGGAPRSGERSGRREAHGGGGSRSRSAGRGEARSGGRAAGEDRGEGSERPTRSRNRQRTRGGSSGEQPGEGGGQDSAGSAPVSGEGGERPARSRNRRRGSRGRSQGQGAGQGTGQGAGQAPAQPPA
jgi:superfamily II DNA/RNA helicase